MTKSKTICLRITEEQYDELRIKAVESNTVISQFVINSLFKQEKNVSSKTIPKLLTIDRIIEVIETKKQKKELDFETPFVLSDVFEPSEWGTYFNVVTIGGTFCKLAQTKGTAVNGLVEWQGKGKGAASYKLKKT